MKKLLLVAILLVPSLEAKYYACSDGTYITPEKAPNGTITVQYYFQGTVTAYLDCTSIGSYNLPDEEMVTSTVINYFCPSLSVSKELLNNKTTLQLYTSEIYISRKSVYPIKKKSDIKPKVFWRLGENSIDETSSVKECEWTTI